MLDYPLRASDSGSSAAAAWPPTAATPDDTTFDVTQFGGTDGVITDDNLTGALKLSIGASTTDYGFARETPTAGTFTYRARIGLWLDTANAEDTPEMSCMLCLVDGTDNTASWYGMGWKDDDQTDDVTFGTWDGANWANVGTIRSSYVGRNGRDYVGFTGWIHKWKSADDPDDYSLKMILQHPSGGAVVFHTWTGLSANAGRVGFRWKTDALSTKLIVHEWGTVDMSDVFDMFEANV